MPKSLLAQDGKVTESLKEGRVFSVTMAPGSTALVERYVGATFIEKVALVAGEVRSFGEFLIACSLQITCFSGSLSYDITHPTARKASVGDAAAGEVGEYKESAIPIAGEITLTTATAADVTTLALTEGDWDVVGVIDYDLVGVTATQYVAAIGNVAGVVPTQAGVAGIGADPVTTQTATFGTTLTGSHIITVPSVRVKVPQAGLTVHLVSYAVFSIGTLKAFGTLRARRAKQL